MQPTGQTSKRVGSEGEKQSFGVRRTNDGGIPRNFLLVDFQATLASLANHNQWRYIWGKAIQKATGVQTQTRTAPAALRWVAGRSPSIGTLAYQDRAIKPRSPGPGCEVRCSPC